MAEVAEKEERINLGEATRRTGFSVTKFHSPKTQKILQEHGAVLEGKGKDWEIPVSVLPLLGTPRPRKKRNSGVTISTDPLGSLDSLKNQLAVAEQKEEEKKTELSSIHAEVVSLRRKVKSAESSIVEEAQRKVEEAERQRAEAERILAEAKARVESSKSE